MELLLCWAGFGAGWLAGNCAAAWFLAAEPLFLGGVDCCFLVVALPCFEAGFFEDETAGGGCLADPLPFLEADWLFCLRSLRHFTQ